MSVRSLLLVGLTLFSASLAYAQSPTPARHLPGYLNTATLPDTLAILPPPPKPGSAEGDLDHTVFLQTRALKGTPRWDLAIRDAVETPAAFLDDFGCALGVTLDEQTAPKLIHLLTRAHRDVGAATTLPKDHYQRPRPFIGNDEPICVPRDQKLIASASYPSGHSTASWAFGLILAELAPDRAGPVLARARSIGESRVVCGVHNLSDVEEGRDNGAALVAGLHGDAQFRTDLDAARLELANLRARHPLAPSPSQCQAADDAAAHTPWLPN